MNASEDHDEVLVHRHAVARSRDWHVGFDDDLVPGVEVDAILPQIVELFDVALPSEHPHAVLEDYAGVAGSGLGEPSQVVASVFASPVLFFCVEDVDVVLSACFAVPAEEDHVFTCDHGGVFVQKTRGFTVGFHESPLERVHE